MENTIEIKDDCFACEKRTNAAGQTKYVCHALNKIGRASCRERVSLCV